MRFSIIIPVYNTAPYLAACMESVIAQSYPYFEAICIDDGSTDHSARILAEYAQRDKRFVVLRKNNGGVSSARNLGLAYAGGDYVLFLDSDDVLNCRLLEYVDGLLRERKADLYIFGMTCFSEKCNFHDSDMPLVRTYNVMTTICFESYEMGVFQGVYHRRLIKGLEFDTNLVRGEDRMFIGQVLSRCSQILRSNFCGYGYRKRNDSAMASKLSPRILENELGFRVSLVSLLKRNGKQFDGRIRHMFTVNLSEWFPYESWRMEAGVKMRLRSKWLAAMSVLRENEFSWVPWWSGVQVRLASLNCAHMVCVWSVATYFPIENLSIVETSLSNYHYVQSFSSSRSSWRGVYCYDFVCPLLWRGVNAVVFWLGRGEDYEIGDVMVCRFKMRQRPSNVLSFIFRRANEQSFLRKVREVIGREKIGWESSNVKRIGLMAVLLPLFIFIVIPLQTYLGSPGLFDYSCGQLMCAGLSYALPFAIAGFVVLFLLGIISGRLSSLFALAILTCLYLETGFLAIGLPALNGVSGFGNLVRGCLDAMVWFLVLFLFLYFRAFIFRNFLLFVSALCLLILASIFDAGGAKVGVRSPLSTGFCSCYDVVKSVQFSRHRNIMVYILDMTPATIITDALGSCPNLREYFPGFTCFRNNICMHNCTEEGLAGLLTGRYLSPKDKRAEYCISDLGVNSFLYPYFVSSNAVYYAGASHDFGFTNRRKHRSLPTRFSDQNESVFLRHSNSIPYFRMKDALLIRTVPYLLKNNCYLHALQSAAAFRPQTPEAFDEDVTYPILANSPLADEPCVLSVIHTRSLHWPIVFNRVGNRLSMPLTIPHEGLSGTDALPYRDAMREAGVWVLTRLGRLFDDLRKKGVYDNSVIVIVADHGCVAMKEGRNDGTESSVLWVKPENSREAFRISNAPTTNAKVHDLICALRESSLGRSEIESMLSSDERIYRADFRGKALHDFGFKLRYKDWVYDKNSNLVEVRQMAE